MFPGGFSVIAIEKGQEPGVRVRLAVRGGPHRDQPKFSRPRIT
jgi:hypothetical protein